MSQLLFFLKYTIHACNFTKNEQIKNQLKNMRKHNDRILFSATDLNGFIECRHKVFLNLKDLDAPLPQKEEDAHARLLKKKGLEHETCYLASLKTSGHRITEIGSQDALENRVRLTMKAMKEGAEYIAQAALLNGQWHGFADLLKRVERPSALGAFSYEPTDIKLAKQPEPSHIIQLCVYSDLLQHCQGVVPHFFSVILGDGEEKASDSAISSNTTRQLSDNSRLMRSHHPRPPAPCHAAIVPVANGKTSAISNGKRMTT